MADPAITSIPKEEWTAVATEVTRGTINRLKTGVKYYQTYRASGEAAPDAIVATNVPEEAVPIFIDDAQAIISSSTLVDVYVCCFVDDTRIITAGKVRVDL